MLRRHGPPEYSLQRRQLPRLGDRSGYTVEFRKVMYSPGKSLTFDLPITTDAQPNLESLVAFIRNDQLFHSTLSVKVPPVRSSYR